MTQMEICWQNLHRTIGYLVQPQHIVGFHSVFIFVEAKKDKDAFINERTERWVTLLGCLGYSCHGLKWLWSCKGPKLGPYTTTTTL